MAWISLLTSNALCNSHQFNDFASKKKTTKKLFEFQLKRIAQVEFAERSEKDGLNYVDRKK